MVTGVIGVAASISEEFSVKTSTTRPCDCPELPLNGAHSAIDSRNVVYGHDGIVIRKDRRVTWSYYDTSDVLS